jgi:pimeloyl-ACP methyl ester carboxylesterase
MNSAVGLVAPYYEEFGVGVPVIMLHGWPAEHGQMVAMMEPLFAERSGWRRIYVDLPGMGRTPGPEWLTTHDLMLDFVDEFIGTVAGEGCALVGHSYGAQLVRGLLQRDTREYAAAMLLSPGGMQVSEESTDAVVLVDEPGFVEALTAERPFLDLFVVRTRPVLQVVRAQSMPGVLAADYEFLARVNAGPRFSYLAEVPKPFAGPVLICSGRQEPQGYQHICALLHIYPRGTCAILDRTGHLLFAEQPALLATLADEWLNRAEEYLAIRSAGTGSDAPMAQ